MKIEGHRCFGMFELPENTKMSVIQSINEGLDSIEFDVRCTADNVMCVTHGADESDEDGVSEIENMSFEQCCTHISHKIKECIEKNHKNFIYECSLKDQFMTVEELLKLTFNSNINLNFEIKHLYFDIESLLKLIYQYYTPDQFGKIRISSHFQYILKKVNELNPKISTGYIICYRNLKTYPDDILSEYNKDKIHPEMTIENINYDENFNKNSNTIHALHISGYYFQNLNEYWLKELKNTGKELSIWSHASQVTFREDYEYYSKMIQLGVNKLCLDKPMHYKKYLRSLNQ
eukprot:Mrub_06394.p1 GENE.Mrub_06394~~Mrub_06394.p1  ORF type:complete len:306 (+),score=34.48 Mrub_06394:50-919(+)